MVRHFFPESVVVIDSLYQADILPDRLGILFAFSQSNTAN